VTPIKLGWIDFSKEQRGKVMSVINLLSEPGVLDELGVGAIRDAFADTFFPGTSTIQTRAKYFLIIPYLFYELEKEKKMNPETFVRLLHERELDLIDILKADGEPGVIGITSGRSLKRKPSEIYWNGLRTFDIFTRGRMSISEYARLYFHLDEKKRILSGAGKSLDSDNQGDDEDAGRGNFLEFWQAPKPDANWRENLTLKLTPDEAAYLKGKIQKKYPYSLFSFLLEQSAEDLELVKDFQDIELFRNKMPGSLYEDYLKAKITSDFLIGLHLRYNVILSQKDPLLEEAWSEWLAYKENYIYFQISTIVIERLKINNVRLIRFLRNAKNAIEANEMEQLDSILVNREKELKGSQRAKLLHLEEIDYKGWVGIDKLQYRWPIVKVLIKDIQEGLGGHYV